MSKTFKLALKDNNLAKREPCGICGREFKPDIGIILFLADSYDIICDDCGKKHSQELYRLLEVYRLFRDDITKIN